MDDTIPDQGMAVSETLMTLTECIPGWVHSHVVQDRVPGVRYAVCQRCHKTLHFMTGWNTQEHIIQEWP